MSESNVKDRNSISAKIQRFGRFLSGMVMPNMGAFIAWGFITALFIPDGWVPNEGLAELVDPMIVYLLPLLIGYTGGKVVGGVRGGVVGSIGTIGVIVGADIPMFLGAMVMGPLGGFLIKKFDEAVEGKIKAGFEMLVNNFSAGIIGMILAILAYRGIGPLVSNLNRGLGNAVGALVDIGLLPLTSIVVEPAKVLFLNNAINHGVLGPIGLQEVKEVGKSVFFLIEANPGPGLGVLLAYLLFGNKSSKQSAPGAIIIHFLGGIHEIYFPYILMNPLLIIAVVLGGASGVLTFNLLKVGLVATPSPGSIFALLAMTPRGSFLGVILGVLVSTIVTLLVASIFLKTSKKETKEDELQKATERMGELKSSDEQNKLDLTEDINKIVFSCDAGMGSSAMGASVLRNKVNKAGLDINVTNTAIDSIPDDADIIITHKSLTQRAKDKAPSKRHISIEDFMNTPVYDNLVEELLRKKDSRMVEEKTENKEEIEETKEQEETLLGSVLRKENILIGLESSSEKEAIDLAGKVLVEGNYVKEEYIEGMHRREELVSTYMGNGIAIPHGDKEAGDNILESGIVILQYPEGIPYGDGETVYIVIGIAGKDGEHLNILSNLAILLQNEDIVKDLTKTNDADYIYDMITSVK